jgi:DNA-binding protein YbaB
MSSPIAGMLQDALAELERRRETMADTKRQREAIRATVTAPRQTVTVTVGGMGEVVEMKFPTGGYKRMTPAELATTIVKTISDAREQALSRYAEVIAPTLPPGLSAEDLVRGRIDPEDLVAGKIKMRTADIDEMRKS